MRRAEAPASGRARGFRPIDLARFQRGVDGLGVYAALPQILAYAHGPVTATRMLADELLDIALFAQQVLGDEPRDDRLDQCQRG